MNNKSFTLIEILVVIVIIGILSGFILILTNNVTDSIYDAERKHDIDNLQKLILSYKTLFGTAPIEATECDIRNDASGCTTLKSALIPEHVQSFPTDPSGTYYKYQSADGSDFTIKATLSNGYTYQYQYSNGFSEYEDSEPEELIVNGDFETGDWTGWTYWMNGEYDFAVSTGCVFEFLTCPNHGGSYAAHIDFAAPGNEKIAYFQQSIDLTNIDELTFWYYFEDLFGVGQPLHFYVKFGGTTISTVNLSTLNTWQQAIIDVSSYSGINTLQFYITSGLDEGLAGTLSIDDISALTN